MITQYENKLPLSPHIRGLGISYASATTLTVAAGNCADSTGSYLAKTDSAITLNGAVVGLNGIDTGALSTSKVYNVFAIWSERGYVQMGVILSLASAPILPQGYDVYRRIGYAVTDGSSQFVKIYQVGNESTRLYRYDAPISVLSGGSSATYVAVSLAACVPAVSTSVVFAATHTPAIAANTAVLRPTGSASTSTCVVSSSVAAVANRLQLECPCAISSSVAKVDYAVTASDTLSLSVVSFVDNL
jgi:hypothetical protein